MQITIPHNSKIDRTEDNTTQIRVPNTDFWVLGQQHSNKRWKISLFDPKTNRKKTIKDNKSTRSFALFSNIVLKHPLSFKKQTKSFKATRLLITNIINKQND